MSLPRILSLCSDGTLEMIPAPELETLRGRQYSLQDVAKGEGLPVALGEVGGDTLEIFAEIERWPAVQVSLCSPMVAAPS